MYQINARVKLALAEIAYAYAIAPSLLDNRRPHWVCLHSESGYEPEYLHLYII